MKKSLHLLPIPLTVILLSMFWAAGGISWMRAIGDAPQISRSTPVNRSAFDNLGSKRLHVRPAAASAFAGERSGDWHGIRTPANQEFRETRWVDAQTLRPIAQWKGKECWDDDLAARGRRHHVTTWVHRGSVAMVTCCSMTNCAGLLVPQQRSPRGSYALELSSIRLQI